jgi:hypothetical protein
MLGNEIGIARRPFLRGQLPAVRRMHRGSARCSSPLAQWCAGDREIRRQNGSVSRARDAVSATLRQIEDTGVGMPSHVIRRIFDPFCTTKDPGVGTGLGLSISHQIVRAMQGEITVDSSPGRGSKFRVMLPVACTQQMDVASEPSSARATAARIAIDAKLRSADRSGPCSRPTTT